MQISIPAALGIAALLLGIGIAIGWNNCKAAVIGKIDAVAKTVVGDAVQHVIYFVAKVKAKL